MAKQVTLRDSEAGCLILTSSDDGDVTVNVGSAFGERATFCTYRGGGKSHETLKALRFLICAMEADGAEVKGG